jgi:hypothetical protein
VFLREDFSSEQKLKFFGSTVNNGLTSSGVTVARFLSALSGELAVEEFQRSWG